MENSKDVLVVDERLLGDAAYRLRIWERTKAKWKAVATQRISSSAAWPQRHRTSGVPLAGLGQRNGPAEGEALRDRIGHAVEHVRRWTTSRCWRRVGTGIAKPLDAGPLSRNYLVPGAVLLTHYRAIGMNRRLRRLEAELRAMAATNWAQQGSCSRTVSSFTGSWGSSARNTASWAMSA
jgi:hypothetical protein